MRFARAPLSALGDLALSSVRLAVLALGEGSAELVHLGEMAMLGGLQPEVFVDRTFNFPTMAEAYRVAVQDLLSKRRARRLDEAGDSVRKAA